MYIFAKSGQECIAGCSPYYLYWVLSTKCTIGTGVLNSQMCHNHKDVSFARDFSKIGILRAYIDALVVQAKRAHN